MADAAVKAAAPSKSQLAYDFIRARIDDGRFVSGFRLVLGQIAGELDISVVPVREAIRRLEAEGLVTFEKNVGAQVALLQEAEYTYTMETLALVEGAATRLSAPLITDDHLRRAREINREMIACLDDFIPHRFTQLNQEFHAVIYEHCPNAALVDLLRDVGARLDAIRRTVFIQIPYRGTESVAEHRRLIALLAEGAPVAKIEAAAHEHKLNTVESFRAWRAEQGA